MPVTQSQVRRTDYVTAQAAETTRRAGPAVPLLPSCLNSLSVEAFWLHLSELNKLTYTFYPLERS